MMGRYCKPVGGAMLVIVALVALAGCASLVGADFDLALRAGDAGGPDDGVSDAGSESSVSSSGGPGSSVFDAGRDAPRARCEGTPTTCTALLELHADCASQAGCTWTTPTCALVTNCASKPTSVACMNAPGCATDFATSTCASIPGYCATSTRSDCQATKACAYSGGCSGTATACESLDDETSCRLHGGCSWR